MFKDKRDVLNYFVILIISFIFASDLFINRGTPASFDQPTHVANIAQFYRAVMEGGVPARWGDGFARYGMPIPIIAQQATSYLGAFFTLFTHDVVTSYNIVVFVGAFLSSLFFYIFLRLYFKPENSIAATVLFNFAPYRIINIYIRGAVPEFFSAVFLPVILIGTYFLLEKKKLVGVVIIAFGVAGVILSHPFMFVVYSLLFVPYTVLLLIKQKDKIRHIMFLGIAYVVGLGLTAYYMLPLLLEIKYFYYGIAKSHFIPNYFLHLENYFNPNWYYYYQNDTYVRGHFLQAGLLESLIVIIFILFAIVLAAKKKKFNDPLMVTVVFAAIVSVFLTFPISNFLYTHVSLLDSLQRPWRMLSTFIFLPPLALAFIGERFDKEYKKVVLMIFIVAVIFLRFPQIYGKNYFVLPQSSYFNTNVNLHGTILNTIWTSDVKDYPVKKFKAEVVGGKGRILESKVRNSYRRYVVKADSDVRMVDYTFYFPGWKVYIDGKESAIQFQDPAYRGVITYNVPQGKHVVDLKFEDTKVRLLGNIISLISFIILILMSLVVRSRKFKVA